MSDRMSRSAKGSMFDGLQIFGKTDAKFSLTNSFHSETSSSSSRPLVNSNYAFSNSAPPTQCHSLPGNIREEEEEEVPPNYFPIEPISLNVRTPSVMDALGRTRLLNPPVPNANAANHSNKNSNPNIIRSANQPTTKQRIDRAVVSSNSEQGVATNSFSRLPPFPSTSVDDPEICEPQAKTKSDLLTDFFNNAREEIKQFEADLEKCQAEHKTICDSVLEKIKSSEDFVKTSALISIQKLMTFETSAQRITELKSQIEESIEGSRFEEAEVLQSEFDEITEVLNQCRLFQFQSPSHIRATEHHLQMVNSSRKSHIDSMKEYCMSLDELSTRFAALSKKIEVKYTSKIEKRKQEIESSRSMLDCKIKHFNIDNEYLNQKEESLRSELKVNSDDHTLQMQYQDEQLDEVQREIRDLEERLKALKLREKAILAEKQKLSKEKGGFETSYKLQYSNLQEEKAKMEAKNKSLDEEKKKLQNRTEEFDIFSSNLDNVKKSQDQIYDKLVKYKSETCNSISNGESLIVNEVHVMVNSETPRSLEIPESLSTAVSEIASHRISIKDKCEEVFTLQRELTKVTNEQLINDSHMENVVRLKGEAINRKQFQKASRLAAEIAKLEENRVDINKNLLAVEGKKTLVEKELESLEAEIKVLEKEAAKLQYSFDEDCRQQLELTLQNTIDVLKGLPPDMTAISRSILEYDAYYIFAFLKMIRHRSKSGSNEQETIFPLLNEEDERIIGNLRAKVGSETIMFREKAIELKEKIDQALRNEDFKTAEDLNSQYEVISGFDSSSGEDDVILIT